MNVLLLADRDDYMEIFMANRQEEPEHVKYLAELAFTKGWPLENIKKTPSACRIHFYRRGDVIVHNSNKCGHLFVVKSVSRHRRLSRKSRVSKFAWI